MTVLNLKDLYNFCIKNKENFVIPSLKTTVISACLIVVTCVAFSLLIKLSETVIVFLLELILLKS